MLHLIDGLDLAEEIQVLAEDASFSGSSHGDAICGYIRKIRYYCKPEWYAEVETLEEWLARGGEIIEC